MTAIWGVCESCNAWLLSRVWLSNMQLQKHATLPAGVNLLMVQHLPPAVPPSARQRHCALLNLNLNLNRAYPRTPLSVHPFRCGLPFPAKAFLASLAKGNQTGAFQWMTRCHAVFRARSSLAANYSTYILERREISGWNGTIPAEDPA